MFKFKYEKILKLKEEYEEDKKIELSKSIQYKEKLINEQNILQDRFNTYLNEFREKSENSVKMYELQEMHLNKKWFKDELLKISNMIYEAEKMIVSKRNELSLAVQERKKYEVLKNNLYAAYIEKHNKIQEQAIEELVSFSATKKRYEN